MGDLICLYQMLKGAYDIDNQLFIPSTVTITRGHTKKLFKATYKFIYEI